MAGGQAVKKGWKEHAEKQASLVSYKGVFKWFVVKTLDGLKKLFEGKKNFAFDTETTGLDYNEARLAGFSFSFDGITGYYVPIAHKQDENAPRECLDYVVSKICDNSIIVEMFNKKFDLNILELCEGYKLGVRRNVKDCQALVWLRDTDLPMPSLKWASRYFLGIEQPLYDEVAGQSTFDYAKVEDIAEYASLDAICTKRLINDTVKKFPGLKFIFSIDDLSVEAVRVFEKEQILLDVQWIRKEESDLILKLKELEGQIYRLAGHEFNINSPKQTANALIGCGLVLTEKTPTKQWAVSESVLSKLDHPITKLLIEHSHTSTYLSTFVRNLLKGVDENGKVRFQYKTCSVVTGRFSSGGDKKNSYYIALNAQNIPKPHQIEVAMVRTDQFVTGWINRPLDEIALFDESHKIVGAKGDIKEFYVSETGDRKNGIRCAFLPDDSDSVWVSMDYSGQELRIAANFSGEPVFVDSFLNGGDPHMATAKKIWGANADKNDRRHAKSANFALQYGGTGYTLANNLGISRAEGDSLYNGYCLAMSTLIAWQKHMIKKAKRDGIVYSAFGRPYHLKKFFKEGTAWKKQSYGERCALNWPIQGTGSDVIRMALSRVLAYWEAMHKAGYDGFTFKSTIHDEINFSVKIPFLHTFLKTAPTKLMLMQFPEWKVPLTAGIDIGPNWGEAVTYKYDVEKRLYTPKGDYYNFK